MDFRIPKLLYIYKHIVTMLYGKYILLPLCIIFAKLLSNLDQLIFLLNAAALLKKYLAKFYFRG